MKSCLKTFCFQRWVPKFEEQFNVDFLKNFKIKPALQGLIKGVGGGRNLIILLGSSGVGRDAVLESCLSLIKKAERIKRSSTRSPRIKVMESNRMLFSSKSDFLKDFERGRIIFAGIYRANNQFYGITRDEILKLKNRNKFYFFECTILSLLLKRLFPEATLIFLFPPSIEFLRRRFLRRGDRDWLKRFRISCSEIKFARRNIEKIFKAGFVDLIFINRDSKKTAVKIIKSLKDRQFREELRRNCLKELGDYIVK